MKNKQKIIFNYPDSKVDMILVDKKLLEQRYNSTSTAIYKNELSSSEPVWNINYGNRPVASQY
jgi:hypothetical protein